MLIKILVFNQGLCYAGGPFILALWSCRMCIATRVIVVNIPQLTTPDSESFSLLNYLKLTKKIVGLHLILSGTTSQAINKNKLLDKSQKIIYTRGGWSGYIKRQFNHRLYRFILALDIYYGIV